MSTTELKQDGLVLEESSAPTAESNSGVLYVKADGKLYYASAGGSGGTVSETNLLQSGDIDGLSAGSSPHQTEDHFMYSDDGTEKKISFSNLEDAIFANVSGNATIAAGGALTIADDAVGADQLAANAVVNASVASGAAIALSKLATATEANIVVHNASGVPVAVALSGDATIVADGTMTLAANSVSQAQLDDDAVGADELAANAVVNASIASNAAIDMDKLDGGSLAASLSDLAQGDLLYAGDVDASNAIKSITFSDLEDAIFGNVSGDATIAAGGALTIAAASVENSMLADDAVGADELAANAVVEASIVDNAVTLAKMAGITRGSIILGDSSGDPSLLAKGSAAQFLQSDGTDPSYVTISGDASVAAGGVLTIGAGAVDYAMIASAAIKDEDAMGSNSASHLATQQSIKAYVDSVAAGLDVKLSVGAATTASFTMASTASTSTLVLADGEGGFDASADTYTVDGVSLSADARVLIKDGVNSNSGGVHNKWNGVYTVGALNGGSLTLTRASDFDAGTEFIGSPYFFVDAGTDNGAHGFVSSMTSAPTLGTTAITFYQFSAPGQDAVAGSGLAMTGNILSVDIDELTELAATPHATQDEFMVSDNGTEKRVSMTNVANGAFALVSGDATVAAGGALTIAAGAVENSMLADDAVGADELAANAVVNASIASNAAIDMDKLDGGSLAASLSDLAQGDLLYAGDVDASNAIKSITFSDLEDAIFGNVSGDAGIAAGGALTIAAGAVENSMLADDAVGADELAANAVVNASVASNAAIAFSKMEAVADGRIIVGNGSNVPTAVATSGDVSLSNAGVFAIAAGVIVDADVAGGADISLAKIDTNVDLGSNITLGNQASDTVTFTGPVAALSLSGATGQYSALSASAKIQLDSGSMKITHKIDGSRATAAASMSGSTWDGAFGVFISGSGAPFDDHPHTFAIGASGSFNSVGIFTNMPMGFAAGAQAPGTAGSIPYLRVFEAPMDNMGGVSPGTNQYETAVLSCSKGITIYGRANDDGYHLELPNTASARAKSWATYSSARYKKNVVQMQGATALDKVMTMRGVNYEWNVNDSYSPDVGFIAEEMAEIVPEVVQMDRHGEATSIDYSRLTSVIVEAMKEQQSQIEDLKSTIVQLKSGKKVTAKVGKIKISNVNTEVESKSDSMHQEIEAPDMYLDTDGVWKERS